jgi:ParB-like chromosome segregation protein Spo0J
LVINQDNELICGRRRFLAIRMFGWQEAPINRIKTEDDIDKLLKTLAENIMRKNMSWQEEVRQKAEVDQLMREKYGYIKGRPKKSSDSEHFWNIEKTAESTRGIKNLYS